VEKNKEIEQTRLKAALVVVLQAIRNIVKRSGFLARRRSEVKRREEGRKASKCSGNSTLAKEYL
jgi:hypothetical protein